MRIQRRHETRCLESSLLFVDADRLCGIIRIRMANSCRAGWRVGSTVDIDRGRHVLVRDASAGMRATVLLTFLKIPLQLFGRDRSRISYERASVVARRSRGLLCVNISARSRGDKQKKGKGCDRPAFALSHGNPRSNHSSGGDSISSLEKSRTRVPAFRQTRTLIPVPKAATPASPAASRNKQR